MQKKLSLAIRLLLTVSELCLFRIERGGNEFSLNHNFFPDGRPHQDYASAVNPLRAISVNVFEDASSLRLSSGARGERKRSFLQWFVFTWHG